MERWSPVLLLVSLWGLCCGLEHDGCRNYHLQFERVFSVPGDVAMLNSTLLHPSVFNLSAEPYNVTWYRLHSDQPIRNKSRRVLVMGEALWLLNITLADAGDYVTMVRTPRRCFRQETKLVVDLPHSQCGRPRTSGQPLTRGVTDLLSCPLKDYTSKLDSYGLPYNITWYKGCEQVSDGAHRFHYQNNLLKVQGVQAADQGLYTCTLHFSLGGARGSVSETMDVEVKGDYCLLPQIHEPAKDIVRAELGSNVTKRCLVFVPCEGSPLLDMEVYWLEQDKYIPEDPSERIYTSQERLEWQDGGVLIDRWLIISELKEQDLNLNYTCKVWSGRGSPYCYFTLLHKDPDLLVPVSLLLSSCLLLFLVCVSVYHVFKLELVLWFRGTFPKLYSNSDGKLYDAYVAYPQRCSMGWAQEVERFALHTLPQVLEEACGYSLYIPDRDCLPGEAVMDSVEENLKVSRCMILLYTASTFSKKYCSNNNNTLLIRPMDQTATDHHSQVRKEHLNSRSDHLKTSKDHLNSSQDHLKTSKDHLNSSQDQLKSSMDHLNSSQDHLKTSKDHLNSSQDHFKTRKDQLNSSQDHLKISKDHLNTSMDHLNVSNNHFNTNKDRLNNCKDQLNTSKDHLTYSKDRLNTIKHHSSKDHLNTSVDHLNISKDYLNNSMDHLNTSVDHLNISNNHFNPSKDSLNTSKDHLNNSMDHLNTSKDQLNTSKDQLNTSRDYLTISKPDINTKNNQLNSSKDHMSTRKVLLSPSEDLVSSCPESCGGMCGHARTQLECVAAMHRALLERSLKVILVELEELGPSDLEQLPESVRHLRQTQGAVCWWKTQGTAGSPWGTGCMQRTVDSETALSSCLSPDCRFWKEVRYRMPVKAKRSVPPETAPLLQLSKTEIGPHRLNTIPL